MICPYNRKSETTVVQWAEDPPDDNEVKSGQTITTSTFEPMPCAGQECGAWYAGRCRYAAVNLDNV